MQPLPVQLFCLLWDDGHDMIWAQSKLEPHLASRLSSSWCKSSEMLTLTSSWRSLSCLFKSCRDIYQIKAQVFFVVVKVKCLHFTFLLKISWVSFFFFSIKEDHYLIYDSEELWIFFLFSFSFFFLLNKNHFIIYWKNKNNFFILAQNPFRSLIIDHIFRTTLSDNVNNMELSCKWHRLYLSL